MSGRIITARHGRPDLSRDPWISAREYGDWWTRYDASGLHPDERPPASLIDLAKNAEKVLSSTLPRAIETASQATKGERDVPANALFVEAPLPPPPFPSWMKLRPGAWGVVSRTLWFCGFAPPGVENHSQAWDRVRQVTALLAEEAERGDVLLCAHGYLNWMIDRQLRKENWTRVQRDGGNRYWSWRIYEPPAGLAERAEAPAPAQ
ncbi:MAG: histidine phosphatase family protein [Pseudomonadota bacterium]